MQNAKIKDGRGRCGGSGEVTTLSGGLFYRIDRIFRMNRILINHGLHGGFNYPHAKAPSGDNRHEA